jgi:hypothetical protein
MVDPRLNANPLCGEAHHRVPPYSLFVNQLFERRLRQARIHDITPNARPGMTYKLDSGTGRCRDDQFSDRVRL